MLNSHLVEIFHFILPKVIQFSTDLWPNYLRLKLKQAADSNAERAYLCISILLICTIHATAT